MSWKHFHPTAANRFHRRQFHSLSGTFTWEHKQEGRLFWGSFNNPSQIDSWHLFSWMVGISGEWEETLDSMKVLTSSQQHTKKNQPIAWYEIEKISSSFNRVRFKFFDFWGFLFCFPQQQHMLFSFDWCCTADRSSLTWTWCIICARWVCRECLCAVISKVIFKKEPYVAEEKRERKKSAKFSASFGFDHLADSEKRHTKQKRCKERKIKNKT